MLGNFSFGDYFKEAAIHYAWEFFVDDLGLEADRIFVSIHNSDDDAHAFWEKSVGLPKERIFRLGDRDNFWQMADTGPCGPCSELHYDMRAKNNRVALNTEGFVELGESGTIIELWNLVFMQFNRDGKGELHPLPSPSIDTGAGLERLASVMQGADSNYHTDLFLPIIEAASEIFAKPYRANSEEGVSYRVLADHARAVGFLLADGVLPSNEGRGYVLRRILRRAGRHAWLLGRREPTVVELVEVVIDLMGKTYSDLKDNRESIIERTRKEEERFLLTIEGGMDRFDRITPRTMKTRSFKSISGEDAFKLYDTFGFPLDLTQLMAEERGYEVDLIAFEDALTEQKNRSRADRAESESKEFSIDIGGEWTNLLKDQEQAFKGYDHLEVETPLISMQVHGDQAGLILKKNPFYAEGGGQVSDVGCVEGEGWKLAVKGVGKISGKTAVIGTIDDMDALEGMVPGDSVCAKVDWSIRCKTQRNHTATHLLHSSLREILGKHVAQRGSLVAPERLRFDFAHDHPMTDEECSEVEERVNLEILKNHGVGIKERTYSEALASGAMALFGEKYSDVVRVVEIQGVSMELCGGTHVENTGEIGLFKIVSETGVAAGVRRIEACTGPEAMDYMESYKDRLNEIAVSLGVTPSNVIPRVKKLVKEKQDLQELLNSYMTSDRGPAEEIVASATYSIDEEEIIYKAVALKASENASVRQWGDAFLNSGKSGVALVGAELPGAKHLLFLFVTGDLVNLGIKANELVSIIASTIGGSGGGKEHMAQAGANDRDKMMTGLRCGQKMLEDKMGTLGIQFLIRATQEGG